MQCQLFRNAKCYVSIKQNKSAFYITIKLKEKYYHFSDPDLIIISKQLDQLYRFIIKEY